MGRITLKPNCAIEILKYLQGLDGAAKYDAIIDWIVANRIDTGFSGEEMHASMVFLTTKGFISEQMENHEYWYQILPAGQTEITRWGNLAQEELAEEAAEKKEVDDRRKKTHFDARNARFSFYASRFTFWLALIAFLLSVANAFRLFDRIWPVSPPPAYRPVIDSVTHRANISPVVNTTSKKG